MEDNVFSEGDGSEEVQKPGTGEDGDRAEDKTPSHGHGGCLVLAR